MGEDFRELNAYMHAALRALRSHSGWWPISIMDGLVHFGYAVRSGGTEHQPEYEITDRGRAYLDLTG